MTNLAQEVTHEQLPMIFSATAMAGEAAMVWGPPATGKSAAVYQWAAANGYRVVEVRLSEIDVLDVRGIPYRDDENITRYAVPSWWPQKGCGKVVLYLDEYAQQPVQAQPITSRIIHERRIGDDNVLPDGDGDEVVIIVSSNLHTDRAGANRMPTHTASRFAAHVQLKADVEQWVAWANGAGIDERIIAFVRFRPEDFYQFDPKGLEYAWPNPRTLEKLSKMIAGVNDGKTLQLLAHAACGEAFAIQFRAFVVSLGALPDLDAIEAGVDVEAPDNPGLVYAVVSALARRVNAINVENVWGWISARLDDEFQVFWAKDAISIGGDFDLTQSPVYHAVLKRHQSLLTA